MWTWKTEEAADWSMQSGITYGKFQCHIHRGMHVDGPGWIPQPIWNKTYG